MFKTWVASQKRFAILHPLAGRHLLLSASYSRVRVSSCRQFPRFSLLLFGHLTHTILDVLDRNVELLIHMLLIFNGLLLLIIEVLLTCHELLEHRLQPLKSVASLGSRLCRLSCCLTLVSTLVIRVSVRLWFLWLVGFLGLLRLR